MNERGVRQPSAKKGAWIIPVNTALLFGILCFWAVKIHDTLWAVISIVLCLINAFVAVRWLQMQSAIKARSRAARKSLL